MADKNTDLKLVRKAQAGDNRAFDLLVLKYESRIANVISKLVWNPEDVLDVSQEAFIKAYRALPNFRGDSAFYTWIYRIAINTAKNYLVAKGRRPPTTDIDAQEAEQFGGESRLKEYDTPENKLYKDELEQTVNKTLNSLPEDLRTAITLREMEGLSYEEIANVMECPVGTVRSRIFRAREAIDAKIMPLLHA